MELCESFREESPGESCADVLDYALTIFLCGSLGAGEEHFAGRPPLTSDFTLRFSFLPSQLAQRLPASRVPVVEW
jgi:hypothetical protein